MLILETMATVTVKGNLKNKTKIHYYVYYYIFTAFLILI